MKYKYELTTGAKRLKTKLAIAFSASALAGSSLVLALGIPLTAKAAGSTVVTPANTQGWSTSDADGADNRGAGSVTFTTDFGAPSGFGSGSLKLSTTDGSDKAQIVHAAPAGTLLSDVQNIGYSTYRQSPVSDPNQVAAINLVIDSNGAAEGGYDQLVFEPVYQPGGVAAIQNDTWQTWDASGNAIWWSTHDINGTCANTCYTSLSDIQAANPDATVFGYVINQGSGNPSLTSGVDAFVFNDTTYNFELTNVPADKDQCKDGGWMSTTDTSGGAFRNQGQCVSYANHNDGNGADDVHAHNR